MRLRQRRGTVIAICLFALIIFVNYRYNSSNRISNNSSSNNSNSKKYLQSQLQLNISSIAKEGDQKVAVSAKDSNDKSNNNDSNNNNNSNNSNNNNNNSKKKKIILLYSTWFDHQYWGSFKGDLLRSEFTHCRLSKNCIATYNKSLINIADALLFHGRDLEPKNNYRANVLQDLRKTAPAKQKWIFLSHETPHWDVNNVYKPYDGIFNWTATFSRDSDVFIPYKGYFKFDNPKEVTKINYPKGKTRLVAWAVSNCLETRQNYALELQRYINLTVYGYCGKNFKNHGDCRREQQSAVNVGSCAQEMASYKFYLAFENAFCHDWVTEKYWRTVTQNIVPVVMGANYDKGAAIPGSFIDVSDFNSIKELADYLLYLDKNDDEYNKYFAWKTKYGLERGSFYCTVCHELNSEKFLKKSQVVLSEAHSVKNNCVRYKYREEKIKRMIQESRSGDLKKGSTEKASIREKV